MYCKYKINTIKIQWQLEKNLEELQNGRQLEKQQEEKQEREDNSSYFFIF